MKELIFSEVIKKQLFWNFQMDKNVVKDHVVKNYTNIRKESSQDINGRSVDIFLVKPGSYIQFPSRCLLRYNSIATDRNNEELRKGTAGAVHFKELEPDRGCE